MSSTHQHQAPPPPSARPPTPPQTAAPPVKGPPQGHYRTPAPPVAPPSIPMAGGPGPFNSVVASNYSMGQITALPGQHSKSKYMCCSKLFLRFPMLIRNIDLET